MDKDPQIAQAEGSDYMKITTQGNGIKIGKRLEEKIAGKLAKFDKYFGEEGRPDKEIRKDGQKISQGC